MKSISSADANRHFSAVLRDVSAGEEVVVVSRGKPVAKIIGVQAGDQMRLSAKTALLKRLRSQPASGVRNWTRNELYE
jgi:prevent-host-death family protein